MYPVLWLRGAWTACFHKFVVENLISLAKLERNNDHLAKNLGIAHVLLG
jgi:hypothetical protein